MMKTIAMAMFLILSSVGAVSAEESVESFYSKVGRTVIRLEHFVEIMSEGDNVPSTTNNPDGTGFFVLSDNRLFLVTARHVVDTDHDLHARVKIFNRIKNNFEIVLLKLPRSHWTFHPDFGDDITNPVDVAAIKLSLPGIEREFESDFSTFSYNMKDASNQLMGKDALPPDQVIVFGFPGDVGFDLFEQRPMGRLGMIAMYTGERFMKVGDKFANDRCAVLDIRVFPGNSGSPVISANGDTKLLGVVTASNNSDIAIMEPASRIREVIDIAKRNPVRNYNYWERIVPK